MDHLLRCACGAFEGRLGSAQAGARVACYCRDCRAFARFLGKPEAILDAAGGTDIVATVPRELSFTRGAEAVQCMSLSPRGLLRWYAGCCRTPIGNTPRDPKFAYVGLVRACLAGSDAEIDAVFGPRRAAVNTASATASVAPTALATFGAVLGLMPRVAAARLGGGWRSTPFFRAGTTEPVAAPQVLTLAEREALADRPRAA